MVTTSPAATVAASVSTRRIAGAGPDLERLAGRCGALLATSAAGKGLFRGSPWDLDVSGGFASPVAAELIRGADVLVGWGCALNMWTLRHGTLVGDDTTVVQVDLDPEALGAHQRNSATYGHRKKIHISKHRRGVTLSQNIQGREGCRVVHQGQVNELLDRAAPKLGPDPLEFTSRFRIGRMR